jgi:hypothetical protein
MDELKDKGKRVIENIGEKRHDLIQKWENKSREYIDTFLLLFGREGRLVSVKLLIELNSLSNVNLKCSTDVYLERGQRPITQRPVSAVQSAADVRRIFRLVESSAQNRPLRRGGGGIFE